MRMARKLGVITYRSALEWDGRFGRVRLDSDRRDDEDPFGLEFEVESYLEGHARRFVRRFDPNCYLYLSRSMDWFDLGRVRAAATSTHGLARIRVERALAIGVRHRHPVPAAAAATDRRRPARRRRRRAVPAAGLAAGPRRVPGRHRALRPGRRRFPDTPVESLPAAASSDRRHDPASASRRRRHAAPTAYHPPHGDELPPSSTDCMPDCSTSPATTSWSPRSTPPSPAATSTPSPPHCATRCARMIRDRDVHLPDCVLEPIADHYARRELYRSPRARLQRRRDDLGPGPGHADPRPLRPVVRRRRLGRRSWKSPSTNCSNATASASASAPPAACTPAPAAPAA